MAQRLAYEQTQGNWVIIPEQGRIDIPASKEYAAVAKATHDKKAFDKALEEAKKKGDAGAIKDAQAKVDQAGDLLKKAKKDYEEAYDQAGDLLKKAEKDYEEAYDQAAKPIDQDEDMPRKPAQTLYERLEGTRVRHVPLRFTDRYRRLLGPQADLRRWKVAVRPDPRTFSGAPQHRPRRYESGEPPRPAAAGLQDRRVCQRTGTPRHRGFPGSVVRGPGRRPVPGNGAFDRFDPGLSPSRPRESRARRRLVHPSLEAQ